MAALSPSTTSESLGLRSKAVIFPASRAMITLRACALEVSSVTVEYWRRSPLLGSSTDRWPVAMTWTFCSSGKVVLRPF